jgi:dihydroorotate dehydrogenase (NAD+) catalytic subunit
MLAGATGVAVGAMNFVNPYTTAETVKGIEAYMKQYNIENLSDIIGSVK